MNYRQRTRFFSSILLLALTLLLLAPGASRQAQAQGQGDVTLAARAGFDGNCKENRWIPVRVTVENRGVDLNARIQVAHQNNSSGQSAYAVDVSLPGTSRKELFLYLYHDSFLGKLNVSLMAGEREIATTPLNLRCISNENLIVGLLTDNPSAYTSLSETTPLNGFTRVAPLQLADLPDRPQGWESLDALVVAGVDMGAISDPQRIALKAWLAQGGKLLVTGGPGWQSAAGGLDEFLPIDLNATQTVNDLSALQNYFKSPAALTSAAALLAVGQVRPNADVLVDQDGVPILVQRQLGFGTVYYLAADPGLQPLSNWDGMQVVYSQLLGVDSIHPSWANSAWNSNASNQALSALGALNLPPTLYIFCLLGLYILVIGPLNYFVLRRLKRQELAWVSIPALVVLFTLVAYFSGYLIRGTRPILNRLAVVQAWDGVDQAQAHALVGIYSPGRTKYALQAGDSFLPYPFSGNNQALQSNQNWLSLQAGGGEMLLPDVLVESGGMKAASLSGSLPAITFTHNLAISLGANNPVLSGTITNTSQYTLRNAILVTPDDTKVLGDFAPGAARQVQVSLAASPAGVDLSSLQAQTIYSNDPGEAATDKVMRRSALIAAVLQIGQAESKVNAGIHLIGWIDEALLPAGLQGQAFDSVDTTLYALTLSPTFTQSSAELKLPPGLFVWESSNPDFSPYMPDYYNASAPAGGYSLRFRLAAPLRYKTVKSLTLTMIENTYISTTTPEGVIASLWDWEGADWVQIPELAWGDIDIPDASRYVGPGGEIKLKIDRDGSLNQDWNQIASSYFTLVVEP